MREIFQLYQDLGSLLPVVEELARRDWRNKAWRTKAGVPRGGQPFDRGSLYGLLTNPLYTGRIQHKKKLYLGEHEPIVEPELFRKVGEQLLRNGRAGGSEVRNRYGALLRGLLRCKACGRTMVHNFTGRNGRRYRYYTCTRAIKSGRQSCPSGSLPAPQIERVVVDHIRAIARDEQLAAEVVRQAQGIRQAAWDNLRTEKSGLERELARHHAENPETGHASARERERGLQDRGAERRGRPRGIATGGGPSRTGRRGCGTRQ